MQVAKDTPELISPRALALLTVDEASELLHAGLEPGSRRDLSERHRLLVSLGSNASSILTFDRLRKWAEVGVSVEGPDGLYNFLETIPAFAEDPLRKKSRVLAHQLCGFGLVTIGDPHNLAPAIDYHLIRLYMRTNRIYPARRDDYERYSSQRRASTSKMLDIRGAVDDAMRYTAAAAELRMDRLNHLEWQIARSFCVREEPRCTGGPLAAKPVDRSLAEISINRGGCPLVGICRARAIPLLQKLQDPTSSRSYY
jgi:hypothetical protein